MLYNGDKGNFNTKYYLTSVSCSLCKQELSPVSDELFGKVFVVVVFKWPTQFILVIYKQMAQ